MKVDCSRAKFVSSLAALGVATASLSGCNAPGMPETTISTNYHQLKKQIFYAVVRGVQCEIQQAVKKQLEIPVSGKSAVVEGLVRPRGYQADFRHSGES